LYYPPNHNAYKSAKRYQIDKIYRRLYVRIFLRNDGKLIFRGRAEMRGENK